ncbi:MAG TPA: DegT/DnrJ/EryC1/StrS family aminotransferase, partial [Candidatus Omnitrophota bacterium]|nr:DegT/DnrJ/EryC1/StrS family aminotransferase [Candidatus Omnitrophota bacterium]
MPKSSKNKFIPVNAPVISVEAKQYVQNCLKTGWLSSAGPYVKKFESAFARYVGAKHGISVSSGTAALHCALHALGLKAGDEVIIPAFTMIASIFAVMYTGAKPVFVDCEPETFNIDTKAIGEKITSKTKALMAVHIFGHPCEMDSLRGIAKKYGLAVIEDAAEAHGALYQGKKCGTLSDIACFSFYANKIITTGEGGMVLTDDDRLAERSRAFRDLCHSPRKRFIHDEVGYNYRMTNIQAAIGLGELKNISRYIKRKIQIAGRYTKQLSKIPGIRPPVTRPNVRNVFWMYGILVDSKTFGMTKDEFRSSLANRGVDTRDFFYPPHLQPAITRAYPDTPVFPNAVFAAKNGCYLPSGLAIRDREIDFVCETIASLR